MPVCLGGRDRILHLISPMEHGEQEVVPLVVGFEDGQMVSCNCKGEEQRCKATFYGQVIGQLIALFRHPRLIWFTLKNNPFHRHCAGSIHAHDISSPMRSILWSGRRSSI